MIDEYIVDYDEYVGIGSGAVSFLDGRVYGNTFSLSAYHDCIDAGRLSVHSCGEPVQQARADGVPVRDRPVRPEARQAPLRA